jgi:hypothetical protein
MVSTTALIELSSGTPVDSLDRTMSFKRQRSDSGPVPSRPAPGPSSHRSSVKVEDLEDSLPAAYRKVLPPAAVSFLFGARFKDAVNAATIVASKDEKISQGYALEDFRRFLAIKVHMVDQEGDIS